MSQQSTFTMCTGIENQRTSSHCRFCAEEKKTEELIQIGATETSELEIVFEYFNIHYVDFNNSDMPQTTCLSCYRNILNSYTLYECIKESQTTLYKLYCIKKEGYAQIMENHDVNLDPLDITEEPATVKSRQSSVDSNTNQEDQINELLKENIKEPVSVKSRHSSVDSNTNQEGQIDEDLLKENIEEPVSIKSRHSSVDSNTNQEGQIDEDVVKQNIEEPVSVKSRHSSVDSNANQAGEFGNQLEKEIEQKLNTETIINDLNLPAFNGKIYLLNMTSSTNNCGESFVINTTDNPVLTQKSDNDAEYISPNINDLATENNITDNNPILAAKSDYVDDISSNIEDKATDKPTTVKNPKFTKTSDNGDDTSSYTENITGDNVIMLRRHLRKKRCFNPRNPKPKQNLVIQVATDRTAKSKQKSSTKSDKVNDISSNINNIARYNITMPRRHTRIKQHFNLLTMQPEQSSSSINQVLTNEATQGDSSKLIPEYNNDDNISSNTEDVAPENIECHRNPRKKKCFNFQNLHPEQISVAQELATVTPTADNNPKSENNYCDDIYSNTEDHTNDINKMDCNDKSNNCDDNNLNIEDLPTKSKEMQCDIDTHTQSLSIMDIKDENGSWGTYTWSCYHCGMECDTMEDLRSHGMQLHKRCYAFKCIDCNDCIYTTFKCFVEHARQHRSYLRFYCPHCNEHFKTIFECVDHTKTHELDGTQMCRWCGIFFPDGNALKKHKTSSRRVPLPRKLYKREPKKIEHIGSWNEYEWTCQECSQRFSTAQLLRTHTQETHSKCFAMKCVDCPFEPMYFTSFVTHVCRHRPHLRDFCFYCNMCIKGAEKLKKHVDAHKNGPIKPCDECGQLFENKELEYQHHSQFESRRNHRFLTTTDLTCNVCKKVYRKMWHLRRHMEEHDENWKQENLTLCETCGKHFNSPATLAKHLLTHAVNKVTYVCKVCDRLYHTKQGLKYHVSTHMELNKFICDHCGRRYNIKRYLARHIMTQHTQRSKVSKKFKCVACLKKFKTQPCLKRHMNIHKPERPYKCRHCEKSFTNWGNCNKHMLRIHNTTLAKTKATPKGRVPIDKDVEEVTNTAQVNKEWMEDVTKERKTGRKKKNLHK